MKTEASIALLSLFLLASNAMAQTAGASDELTESLHLLRLSRGGDLNVLTSKRTGLNPDIAVLLFPGYPGILKLREDAGSVTYALAGNFVIRARRFLNSGTVFTIAVDCPVERKS